MFVRAIEQMLGAGMLLAAEGIEAFEQAAMDGGGGLAVELLVDDALDQRLERRLRAGKAHVEWACALDEAAELGIGGGEFLEGERGVVTRGARTVVWTRHEMTVSQDAKKVFRQTRTILVPLYKGDTFLAG